MIQSLGTGPQKRLSSLEPRLSPIMKYISGGIVIVFGRSQPPPIPRHGVDEAFIRFNAVDDGVAVVDAELVARPGDDTLDEVRVRLLGDRLRARLALGLGRPAHRAWSVSALRRMEDDDVADRGVAELVGEPVDENALVDLQRRDHRTGRDLVRLDDVCLDQQRQADGKGDDRDELDERAGCALRARHLVVASEGDRICGRVHYPSARTASAVLLGRLVFGRVPL